MQDLHPGPTLTSCPNLASDSLGLIRSISREQATLALHPDHDRGRQSFLYRKQATNDHNSERAHYYDCYIEMQASFIIVLLPGCSSVTYKDHKRCCN